MRFDAVDCDARQPITFAGDSRAQGCWLADNRGAYAQIGCREQTLHTLAADFLVGGQDERNIGARDATR